MDLTGFLKYILLLLDIIYNFFNIIFNFFNIIFNFARTNKSIEYKNSINSKKENINYEDITGNKYFTDEIKSIIKYKYMNLKQFEQMMKSKGKYTYICVFNDIHCQELYNKQMSNNIYVSIVWKNWDGNGNSAFGVVPSDPIIYKVKDKYAYFFQVERCQSYPNNSFINHVDYWLRVRNYCYKTQYTPTIVDEYMDYHKTREDKRFNKNYGYVDINHSYIRSSQLL